MSESCVWECPSRINGTPPRLAVWPNLTLDDCARVSAENAAELRKLASSLTADALARAIHTTGKTVLFTGLSLTASIIYFVFFPMKFQSEMAILLTLLLFFHVVGALAFIPGVVSLLKPRFPLPNKVMMLLLFCIFVQSMRAMPLS